MQRDIRYQISDIATTHTTHVMVMAVGMTERRRRAEFAERGTWCPVPSGGWRLHCRSWEAPGTGGGREAVPSPPSFYLSQRFMGLRCFSFKYNIISFYYILFRFIIKEWVREPC